MPVILYEGENFFVRGSNLGWKFIDNSGLEFAAVGEYLAGGYESGDSDYVRGMSDRDPSFGIGDHATRNPDKPGFKMIAVTDVSDNSDGQQVRGEIFYKYRTGDWMFRPSAGFVRQSDDYNDYYHGVKNSEVLPAGLRYDFFGDEITDSPIVDEGEHLSAFIAVAYTFGK